MGWSIFAVVIYLLIVAYLGYRGWRVTATATDYMVAGREVHPYVMAMSYGATFISTSAIIGFGGAASLFGMGILWLTWMNVFFGIFIAFAILGKRTRRLGHVLDSHTFPELLGRRYQSTFIQGFSGIVIFLFMPIYAAAVLIGISRFIEVYLGVPFAVGLLAFSLILAMYVILGGLKGVMYTDAFQGTIMLITMIILLIYTYILAGGVTPAHQFLTDMTHLVPEKMTKLGHRGWAEMPRLGSPYWWTLISTIICGVGIGVLAQPQLVIRFMTVKRDRELNRAVPIGSIFILSMTGIAFTVGILTNVIFYEVFGEISVAVAEGNIDKVIPLYIGEIMPGWFGTLFLLAMIAASMSTLSSQYHVGGTSLGRDFYEKGIRGERIERGERTIFVTRLGIALSILLCIVFSLIFSPSIIAVATAIFFGLCGATFLPSFVFGLYWKGMTKAGAITSVLGGFLISMIWMGFFHAREAHALGFAKYLFGKPALAGFPWAVIDAQFIALPISFFLAIGVSLISGKLPDEHIERCWKYF
ncbi:MAG: sodium:solute symporter family protein [Proteobacteria bacterium]|nr:sodium:solute symporter family protein [Pseudomonadota bacterium]